MKWKHHIKKMIAVKVVITGCLLAILVHPYIGQLLGVGGSLLWLWVDTLERPNV